MRILPSLAGLAACVVLAAVTSGCSVNIVDGQKPAMQKTEASDAKHRQDDETPAADDSSDSDDAPDAGAGISREELIADAAKVMRCDGELTILDDAVAVYVEGSCDRLILNSRGSQVVTDDVRYLEVIGDANLVLSGEVDQLLVNGNGNTVHWAGATPRVSDVGSTNVLTAG